MSRRGYTNYFIWQVVFETACHIYNILNYNIIKLNVATEKCGESKDKCFIYNIKVILDDKL